MFNTNFFIKLVLNFYRRLQQYIQIILSLIYIIMLFEMSSVFFYIQIKIFNFYIKIKKSLLYLLNKITNLILNTYNITIKNFKLLYHKIKDYLMQPYWFTSTFICLIQVQGLLIMVYFAKNYGDKCSFQSNIGWYVFFIILFLLSLQGVIIKSVMVNNKVPKPLKLIIERLILISMPFYGIFIISFIFENFSVFIDIIWTGVKKVYGVLMDPQVPMPSPDSEEWLDILDSIDYTSYEPLEGPRMPRGPSNPNYIGPPQTDSDDDEDQNDNGHVNGNGDVNGNENLNGNGDINGNGHTNGNGHANSNGHVNGNGHANGNVGNPNTTDNSNVGVDGREIIRPQPTYTNNTPILTEFTYFLPHFRSHNIEIEREQYGASPVFEEYEAFLRTLSSDQMVSFATWWEHNSYRGRSVQDVNRSFMNNWRNSTYIDSFNNRPESPNLTHSIQGRTVLEETTHNILREIDVISNQLRIMSQEIRNAGSFVRPDFNALYGNRVATLYRRYNVISSQANFLVRAGWIVRETDQVKFEHCSTMLEVYWARCHNVFLDVRN